MNIFLMTVKKILPATLLLLACVHTQAQDTLSRQRIEITSSYKPHLRSAAKINFSASPLKADTSAPRLAYSIPAQNLFFAFQPIILRPLPLGIDTALLLGTRNYVKAGFGSFTTPYVEGAIGFGDGKNSMLNLYADYISSRGKITYQDFSEINAKASGALSFGKNQGYGSFGISQNEYYQYGYDHNLYQLNKSDIRRSYRDLFFTAGLKNKEVNDAGVNYDPHIELHAFTRENKGDESTLIANLPAEKTFGDNVKVKVAVLANINGYNNKTIGSGLKITNSLFQVAPAVEYQNDIFSLNAGITPSWNNGVSALLPNIYGTVKLEKQSIAIQGGWVGRYLANSFRTLSKQNPYITDPTFLNNTREMQYYGGIKATVGNHFNFNAKAAFYMYKDMPLFLNDNNLGNTFLVVNESHLNNFQIHGDMNFISQDKFSLTAGLDFNSYSGLKNNTNAWGLYPLMITGSFRWNAMDQLIIKGDLASFSGAKAMDGTVVKTLTGGTDLSIGAEFKINKMFSAWLDINNLLNSKYQWWYHYPVYGLQAIGGVIVRF